MHAVAPEIGAAHQNDDTSRPPPRLRIGSAQAPALRRREGAIVEIKMQIADGAVLLVTDFAAIVGWFDVDVRQSIGHSAKRQNGGTFEAALHPVGRLQLTDPHGAVPSGAANRTVAAGDD